MAKLRIRNRGGIMSINFTDTWVNNSNMSNGNISVYSAVHPLAGGTNYNYSLSFWFKTSQIGGKFLGSEEWTQGSDSSSYDRLVYCDSNGLLRFGVYPNSYQGLITTGTYHDGNWHHVIATQSSSTGMSLMVDGGTRLTNDVKNAESLNTNRRWICGMGSLWDYPDKPSVFKVRGAMQDVRVYSRSLTENEGRTIAFSYGKDNINENLYIRWFFGNGVGNYPSPIKDMSGNGNDGTIYIPGATNPVYDSDIVSATRRVA